MTVNIAHLAHAANAHAVSYAGAAVQKASEMKPIIEEKGLNFTAYLAQVHEQMQGMISAGPLSQTKMQFAAADLESMQGRPAGGKTNSGLSGVTLA